MKLISMLFAALWLGPCLSCGAAWAAVPPGWPDPLAFTLSDSSVDGAYSLTWDDNASWWSLGTAGEPGSAVVYDDFTGIVWGPGGTADVSMTFALDGGVITGSADGATVAVGVPEPSGLAGVGISFFLCWGARCWRPLRRSSSRCFRSS